MHDSRYTWYIVQDSRHMWYIMHAMCTWLYINYHACDVHAMCMCCKVGVGTVRVVLGGSQKPILRKLLLLILLLLGGDALALGQWGMLIASVVPLLLGARLPADMRRCIADERGRTRTQSVLQE